MDAAVVVLLTFGTLALGMALWHLLVRPDAVLARADPQHDGWFETHPGALRALRWAVGASVFLLGFLTGLATAFLSRVGP